MTPRKTARKGGKTGARKAGAKGSKKAGRKSARKTGRAAIKAAKLRGSAPPPSGYTSSWSTASDPSASEKERIEAFQLLGNAACDDPAVFEGTIAVLRNTSEPVAVRLAALAAIQASSFSSTSFAARRPQYLAALRAVATDPEPRLRSRALGVLAREKDARAQTLLLEGLKDPTKALVSPEKALQLLSYDIKAEAYPLARKIAQQPPNQQAKREALRLLAADAKSAKLFEDVLRDKKESSEIRQIAAAALQALDPDALQAQARRIVLDEAEAPELQATSLAALTYFGDESKIATDNALGERIATLQGGATPDQVKQSAKQFTSKYGR